MTQPLYHPRYCDQHGRWRSKLIWSEAQWQRVQKRWIAKGFEFFTGEIGR